MSLYARLAAVLALAVALLAGWHAITTRYDRQGYERAKAEDRAAAQEQAERNRELQRQAERRYIVEQGVRDRFHTVTVRELSDASSPLAACPVPAGAVRVLRDAYRCAAEDSAAACGPRQPVSAAR